MDYKDIIESLDGLKDHCEIGPAVREAMDIISDYEKVAVDAARMSQHYETVAKPIMKSGVWVCPACGKKIPYHHSFCHWCGKKIGWKFR